MFKRIASTAVAVALTFSAFTFPGGQAEAAATVKKEVVSKVNNLNVREDASLKAKRVSQVSKGEAYKYLGKKGDFYKISFKGKVRYISATKEYTYVRNMKTEEKAQKKVVSKVNRLNVREGASLKAKKVAQINKGEAYKYLGKNNEFYKISYEGKVRYVSSNKEYTQVKTVDTTETPATEPAKPVAPAEPKPTTDANSSTREKLAKVANQYQGSRYVYGGTTPAGFDCSGFTSYVYKQATGKTIPRDSRSQYALAKKVSRSNIQAGDLIFFSHTGERIQHVGIAVSNTAMINAETPARGIRYASFSSGYWAPRYVGAGHYL